LVEDDGVLLKLQVVPGASRRRVLGAAGGRLRVALVAPPERGRANRELLELLAVQLDVPMRSLTLVRGSTSRLKQVRVLADAHTGLDQLVDRARRVANADADAD
jgi:uncharacterized protein (TIGR00251 family)